MHQPFRRQLPRVIALSALFSAPALASANSATTTSGGLAYGGKPTVKGAECATGEQWTCRAGERLTLSGRDLEAVTAVEFLGGRGRSDDRRARPRRSTDRNVTVVVPKGATSGPVRARTASATAPAKRRLRILPAAEAADATASTPAALSKSEAGVFPIDGKHDMGQSETNSFGGGRNHGGHDLFAACGTPLVAVRDAKVQAVDYEGRAGNYVVLQGPDGRAYAYMHLGKPSPLQKGDRVSAGDRVGSVGQTGAASGCHLHFELWTAPGWYTGGKAVDPLPLLKELEAGHEH